MIDKITNPYPQTTQTINREEDPSMQEYRDNQTLPTLLNEFKESNPNKPDSVWDFMVLHPEVLKKLQIKE